MRAEKTGKVLTEPRYQVHSMSELKCSPVALNSFTLRMTKVMVTMTTAEHLFRLLTITILDMSGNFILTTLIDFLLFSPFHK